MNFTEFSGGNTTFDHAMNWKLAIDTFGETYHFNTLHRDTLAQDFYGNAQMYDRYERNHRMMLYVGLMSNAQDYLTFRRNEPALHHYHNTYREALGMPPLEVIGS